MKTLLIEVTIAGIILSLIGYIVFRDNVGLSSYIEKYEGYENSAKEQTNKLEKNLKLIRKLENERIQYISDYGFDNAISKRIEKDIEDIKYENRRLQEEIALKISAK